LTPGGSATIGNNLFVAASGDNVIYKTGENTVIELTENYLGLAKGTVTLSNDIPIMGTDTMELAGGTVFKIANGKTLSLLSNNTGGVTLIGDGKLVVGTADTTTGKYPTEIVGGSKGWRAVSTGEGLIKLTATESSGSLSGLTITAEGTTAPVLTALGLGATITQNAIAPNTLIIAANTVIDLAGTSGAKVGEIVLRKDTTESGSNHGKLTFAATTSSIKVGDGTGVTELAGADTIKINNVEIGGASDFAKTNFLTNTDGYLNKIVGVADKSIWALNGDILINSTVKVVGTAAAE
jgi:hypothetical protein